MEDYWDELEQRYGDGMPEATPDVQLGYMLILQVIYIALYRGADSVVQIADTPLQQEYFGKDKPLGAYIAQRVSSVLKSTVDLIVMNSFKARPAYGIGFDKTFYATEIGKRAKELSNNFNGVGAQFKKFGKYLWSGNASRLTRGVIGLAAVAVIAVMVWGLIELGKAFIAGIHTEARIVTATLVGLAMFAVSVVRPAFRVYDIVKATQIVERLSRTAALQKVLLGQGEWANASKKASIVGLVIAVGIAVGTFIYAVTSADLPPGSVAFNQLLAQTIAATILAIVLFALSLTVVGAIFVALITVIDLVFTLLGLDEYSISAQITKSLGEALYHFDLLVDTNVDMGPFSIDLANPLEGPVEGAQLRVRSTLTTTATHKDPTDLRLIPYTGTYYTQSQLRKTSFIYSLTQVATTLATEIDAMRSEWQLAFDHKWEGISMYRGTATSNPEATVTLTAGINNTTDLVLNTAYAIPGVECWTIPVPYPVTFCEAQSIEDGNSSTIKSAVVLDVLPQTLDEFWALAWAQNNAFTHQRDHDGDGLINPYFAGNDPNDETWDADGDGLSDRFELEMRQLGAANGGGAFGPLDPDTDSDGLSDRQELFFGTNPSRRDSDGDLIIDVDEIYHQDLRDWDEDGDTQEWIGGWMLPLVTTDTLGITSTLTVLVRSDPLVVDGDGDGLGDATEKTLATLAPDIYPFLPRVYNDTPVKFFAATDDTDGIVGPGQTFVYSATVENQLALDLYVLGTISTTVPAPLTSSEPVTAAFNVFRQDAETLTTQMTVPVGTSDNRTVSLTSETVAYQHDGDVRIKWRWSPAAVFTPATTQGWPWYSAIAPAVDTLNQGNAYAIASIEGNYAHDPLSATRVGQIDETGAYLRYGTGVIGGAIKASWEERPPGPGPVKTEPEVVCAGDTGRCLTVWADDSYDTCTTVTFNDLVCHSDQDGQGSHSEYYIEAGGLVIAGEYRYGRQIWGPSSTATGQTEKINVTRAFCNTEKYALWEEDTWFDDDDYYGTGSYSATEPGAGSKRHTGADATIDWFVYPNYNATIYGRLFDANGWPVQGSTVCTTTEPIAVSTNLDATMLTPAVATDGTNFMVVWNQDNVLRTNRFTNSCVVDEPRDLFGSTFASLNPDIVWAGNRYIVVWQKAGYPFIDWDIQLGFVSINGISYASASGSIASSPSRETNPAIAYNAVTGQSLIVYIVDGTQVMGRFFGTGAPETAFPIATGAISTVDVAYEPTHGGWMVTWLTPNGSGTDTIHYKPLAADGTGMLNENESDLTGSVPAPYTNLSSTGVACRLEAADPIAGECGIVANPETPDATTDPQSIALAKVGLLKVLPWSGTYNLSANLPMIIDATGPDASFTSLQNSQYLTATQTLVIGGDANDNTYVAQVWVSVDGGDWQLAAGAESWAYAWDTAGLTDGPHTLRAYATDVAGNDGNIAGITVYIDSQAPIPTSNAMPGDVLGATQDTDSGWHVTLTGNVNDPQSGGQPGSGATGVSVLVTPRSTGWQTATVAGGALTLSYPLSTFDDQGAATNPSGIYTLSVRTSDALANASAEGAVVQVPFYIDATPPEADLNYPAQADLVVSNGSLSFTGVFTDPEPPAVVANVSSIEIAVVPSGDNPDAFWTPATADNPGSTTSPWSSPIGTNLEGIFEISLRGTDEAGNRQDSRDTWVKWQGEIDTQSPRAAIAVTYRGAGRAAQTLYSGIAEDFNLVLDGLVFPCAVQARDRTYYTSPWWDATTGVGTRLTRITPSCIVRGYVGDPADLQVSDRYGHTTIVLAHDSGRGREYRGLHRTSPGVCRDHTNP